MIYPKTQSWSCHDCKVGGTVIDWLAKENGISGADALRELAASRNGSEPAEKFKSSPSQPGKAPTADHNVAFDWSVKPNFVAMSDAEP